MKFKVWPWRRTVQLLVLFSLIGIPILARYTNYLSSRQLDKVTDKWDGTFQGEVLQATDTVVRIGLDDGEGGVATRRPRQEILDRTEGVQGSPWSYRFYDLSLTDLLAGAESFLASRDFPWVLFLGLIIPLLATLLLGRVFCGWVCPMAFFSDMAVKLRSLFAYLEIKLPNIRIWKGHKYVLLAVGLIVTLAASMPILNYIYPPALFGREGHVWVNQIFDNAENGLLGLAVVGLTGASVFILLVLLVETLFAPGFWCRALCPGGALYALLSKIRLLRVRRDIDACTPCGLCDKVCPMELKPSRDVTGIECDSCGLCIDICPDDALHFKAAVTDAGYHSGRPPMEENPKRKFSPLQKIVAGLCLLLLLSVPAHAHHIMGIPHYSYDESYPQAPVLKLVQDVGTWEFQLTGYPGNPQPGNRTQINVYVVDKQTRNLYPKPVKLYVYQQSPFGANELVYGPKDTKHNENLFKFYPTYPEEGNYEVMLEFEDLEGMSTLRFPMVVGSPGSPLVTLGGYLILFGLFFVVIRAVKIKRARRLEAVA